MSDQPQNIVILGSTGSVGVSTLNVIQRNPDCYRVFALTANTNVQKLLAQCFAYQPKFAVMRDKQCAQALAQLLKKDAPDIQVLAGCEGLCEVAGHDQTDAVMAAIVGAAGLQASLAAALAGKRLMLANKEALVMSGDLFMRAVEENGATLLPIDSEHNAIYQCMANGAVEFAQGIRKILLTGSGGPLLRIPESEMATVTVEQACAHPNWNMGRKISVDSATMMNKGLELIEAKWLFSMPIEQIEIVIHPQSIIHSMVEYIDGSIVAQMGNPDMRIPIAHGLAWPDRIESGVNGLNLLTVKALEFEAVDRQRFPCIELAETAAAGLNSSAIGLNAANEIAVDAFLHELIPFGDIPFIVEKVLSKVYDAEHTTIAEIIAADEAARINARELVLTCRRRAGKGK
ncbi:MAG: 1-deoxy-D-xylulose-5-phosphate reductoisomerase [Pseudomonadales bacterium]|nr:1-deoxy-D-xylulose-5-phosphate reductoisomerase [Pseudomonadales bacterium]